MSATHFWIRRHQIELVWGLFCLANLAAMAKLAGTDGGTIPFHFIWVSLTLLYGFRVWSLVRTALVLVTVMASTAAMIVLEVILGPTRPDELAEVPLMAAMFAVMAWHSRRRRAAEGLLVEHAEREREFMRDSSHHLKMPIAIARGRMELIRLGGLTSDQESDADLVLEELDRMARIVDGLLRFNATQALQVRRRLVDLARLVRKVVERWSDTVDRRWIVHGNPSIAIEADEAQLLCALDALIENAVDATGVGDTISLGASVQHGRAVVHVTDTGVGIPPEALPHVFERFWTRSRGGGRAHTGLGLAIVEATVRAHGGTLDVRSGYGTTVFTLQLGPVSELDADGLPLEPARSRTVSTAQVG